MTGESILAIDGLSVAYHSVKVIDDNRIRRIFPGIDGMELDYVRCPAGSR